MVGLVDGVGSVVEGARENARRRRLAGAAHAGQHIGLRDAAGEERVAQSLHQCASWPIRSSNVRGRYLRASTTYGFAGVGASAARIGCAAAFGFFSHGLPLSSISRLCQYWANTLGQHSGLRGRGSASSTQPDQARHPAQTRPFQAECRCGTQHKMRRSHKIFRAFGTHCVLDPGSTAPLKRGSPSRMTSLFARQNPQQRRSGWTAGAAAD